MEKQNKDYRAVARVVARSLKLLAFIGTSLLVMYSMRQCRKPIHEEPIIIDTPVEQDTMYVEHDILSLDEIQMLERIYTNHAKTITDASNRYGVPVPWIVAVIAVESGGNPKAKSPAGAMGMMQLMPITIKCLKKNHKFDIKDPYNVWENIHGGTKYLAWLSEQLVDLELTIAAYNAGIGNVRKYNDVPLYKETQNYIDKFYKYVNYIIQNF